MSVVCSGKTMPLETLIGQSQAGKFVELIPTSCCSGNDVIWRRGAGKSSSGLTPRQREFLAGYVPDICFAENKWLEHADRAKFVATVAGMDFDGQLPDVDVRVAKNLAAKGFFYEFDVHHDVAGQACLYVQFSAIGADAVFDVMQRGR